jgi:hypothetical protein
LLFINKLAMKDYFDVLNKWSTFSAGGKELRKEVLDSLHTEVKKSFDVITRISIQEIGGQVENKEYFEKVTQLLEGLLAFSIFGGYILFMIEKGMDPVGSDLASRESTQDLGRVWVEEQKKDGMKDMLSAVDPIVSMFLVKAKQTRMNQLFASFPETMEVSYKDVALIDKFLGWAGHQGYIVGQIEDNLSAGVSSQNQPTIREA